MRDSAVSRVLSRLQALALAVLVVGPAFAQTTNTTITGVVTDNQGVLPGAAIVAVDTKSGFRYEAFTDADGGYRLSGLSPGTYEIKVSAPSFKEQSRVVQVRVGDSVTADFLLTFEGVFVENVTVVGTATQVLVDTRNPELATSITQEQIELLPQGSRNFLKLSLIHI